MSSAHTALLWRRLLGKPQLNAPSLRSEFNGVGQKVQDDLVQTGAVADDVLTEDSVYTDIKTLGRQFHLRLNNRYNALYDFPKGRVVHVQKQFAAFYLRHIQHVVDQSQQVMAGGAYLFDAVVKSFAVIHVCGGNCRHALDGVHRSTYVMAHVGKEFAFRLARLFRDFPRTFRFSDVSIGKPDVKKENAEHDRNVKNSN